MSLERSPASLRVDFRHQDALLLAVITALWVLMAAVARPFGDFPLNDDWVNALSVRTLLATGRFELFDWSQATVLPQTYWGALWAKCFGFSFDTLRLSTAVLGVLAMCGTYLLLREVGGSRALAGIGAAAAGCANPMYHALAHSFMSDVPFYFAFVVSLWMTCRGLTRSLPIWLLGGAVFGLLALLNRQLGFVLPLGFAVAYILSRRLSTRSILIALAPLIVGVAAYAAVQYWLKVNGRVPANTVPVITRIYWSLMQHPWQFVQRLISTAYCIGALICPLVIPIAVSRLRQLPATKVRVACIRVTLLSAILLMPLWRYGRAGNIMEAYGIGPLTLRDTYGLAANLPVPSLWAYGYWIMMTLAAAVTIALFIEFAIRAFSTQRSLAGVLRSFRGAPATIFVATAMLVYVALIVVVTPNTFDRYALPCVPLAMAIACIAGAGDPEPPRAAHAGAAVALIPGILFSVLALHDYFAWNEARWKALAALNQQGITAARIDGGYEYNGWLLNKPGGPPSRPGKSWWWVEDDEYIVAFGEIPNYDRVSTWPVQTWLTANDREIVVLRRRQGAGKVD